MCVNPLKRDICGIEGTKPVILVAPHAFDGDSDRGLGKDDQNTGTLTREMAVRHGFYAVINDRYKRTDARHDADMNAGFIDCNRIDQVTSFLKASFLDRIISFKEAILDEGGHAVLVVHLHGAHNRSFDAYQRQVQCPQVPGILLGYGQGEVPTGKRLTAAKTLIDRLIAYLTGQNGNGIPAVKTDPAYPNYCGRNPNNLNQLFRNGPYADPGVQSIQIEIKKAYRRSAQLMNTALVLGAALSKLADDCLNTFENRRSDSRKGAKIAKMDENSLGKEIVDAAIGVHREPGPGLLETVYDDVLLDEIRKRGFRAERHCRLPLCAGACVSTKASGLTSSWRAR